MEFRIGAYLPSPLIEVLNGMLVVVLFWMACFVFWHLLTTAHSLRSRYRGLGGLGRVICRMYAENKPEIALMVITSMLTLRTWTLWYARHIRFHHENVPSWFEYWAGWLLLGTTIGIIIGVSCWIRVISPFPGRAKSFFIWTLMVLSAFAFGFGMLYH